MLRANDCGDACVPALRKLLLESPLNLRPGGIHTLALEGLCSQKSVAASCLIGDLLASQAHTLKLRRFERDAFGSLILLVDESGEPELDANLRKQGAHEDIEVSVKGGERIGFAMESYLVPPASSVSTYR